MKRIMIVVLLVLLALPQRGASAVETEVFNETFSATQTFELESHDYWHYAMPIWIPERECSNPDHQGFNPHTGTFVADTRLVNVTIGVVEVLNITGVAEQLNLSIIDVWDLEQWDMAGPIGPGESVLWELNTSYNADYRFEFRWNKALIPNKPNWLQVQFTIEAQWQNTWVFPIWVDAVVTDQDEDPSPVTLAALLVAFGWFLIFGICLVCFQILYNKYRRPTVYSQKM